jgi:hypothetical protein
MVGRTVFLVVAALILGQASTDAQSPSLPIPVRVETLIGTTNPPKSTPSSS